jgi:hypothetical protein
MTSSNIYAQSDNRIKFSITTGFLLNLDYEYDNQYAGYIIPSARIDRHEFYIGPLVNERQFNAKFKPSIGGLTGYRFYLEKNEKVLNVFVQYSFQFMRYEYIYNSSYNSNVIISFPYQAEQEKWRDNVINNVIGYGLKIYLNKTKTFSFDHTIGYSIILYSDKNKNNHFASNEFSWSGINLTGGFCYRFHSLKKEIN